MTSSSSDDPTASRHRTRNGRKTIQPISIPSSVHRPMTTKRSATMPVVVPTTTTSSSEFGRTTVEQLETAVLASLCPVGDIHSSAQLTRIPPRDQNRTPTLERGPFLSRARAESGSLLREEGAVIPPGAEELDNLRVEGADTPRAASPASAESSGFLSPQESSVHTSSPESGTLRLLEQYKESEVENRRSAMLPSPVKEHPSLVEKKETKEEETGGSTSESEIAIFVEEGSSSFDDGDSSDDIGLDVDVDVKTHARYWGFGGEGFGDCDDEREDEDENENANEAPKEVSKHEPEQEHVPHRRHHHHHHKHKRWHPPKPPDPDFLSPTGEFTRSTFVAVPTHKVPPKLRGAVVSPGVLGQALGLDFSAGAGWTSGCCAVNGSGRGRRVDSGSNERDVERGRSHAVRPLGSVERGDSEGSPRRSREKGRTKREKIVRPRMVSVGSG